MLATSSTVGALLALAPLVVLVAGLTVLRLPTFRAALLALAVLALATTVPVPPGELATLWGVWGRALADALVLTATVAYTLFFGLLLYRLLEHGGALATLQEALDHLGQTPLVRLAWVLLVVAPLFESITGFGLGVVVAAPLLRGLGYGPWAAMRLSLIGQLAVPWGALAIGMALGASLVGLPFAAIGTAAAVANVPVLFLFAWMALRIAGLGPTRGEWVRLTVGLAVFAAAVWATNRWVGTELGGIAGPAALGAWLRLTERGRARADSVPPARALLRAGLPIAVLVTLLLLTRLVPFVHASAAGTAVVWLPGAHLSLPLLYNPGACLLAACLAAGLVLRLRPSHLPPLLLATLRQWWPATRAILALVLVARALAESGLAGALGQAGAALPGALALGAVAPFGALGGFLTGSVAAANALFLDLALGVGAGHGAPPVWLAGVYCVLAAAFTAFSPARLVFAAVMTGQQGREGEVLRGMAPLIVALLAWGLLAAAPAVSAVLSALAGLNPE